MEAGALAVRILLVEDEPRMSRFIAKGLRENAYAVDISADGEDALYRAEVSDYDLLILDVRLPHKDGFAVCRELRARQFRSPILMLTARDGVDDMLTGLDQGADDYLTKPFDFRVLLARMRTLLRRTKELRPNLLQVADLTVDTLSHSVTRNGRHISLTAKEYALLELLVLRAGQLLGRATIAEHVWDEEFDPFSNVIDVYVNRLRKKIDQGAERQLIHTRRGEGYILSADAEC